MGAVKSYMRGDIGGALKSVVGFGKKAMNGNSAQNQTRQTKTSNADVIMWSGYASPRLSATRIDGVVIVDVKIRKRARTLVRRGKQQER